MNYSIHSIVHGKLSLLAKQFINVYDKPILIDKLESFQ